ncbi:MAG: transposase, partial [Myxococcota bacterium]
MRGSAPAQSSMVCLMDPESLVPAAHPIRSIKKLADGILSEMSPVFDEVYAERGRASVPPERLLKSMLLMALYGVRSERQLCEQLQYNMMFRWFLDMSMTENVFDASTFSKNRERFLSVELTAQFFDGVVEQARTKRLMSDE